MFLILMPNLVDVPGKIAVFWRETEERICENGRWHLEGGTEKGGGMWNYSQDVIYDQINEKGTNFCLTEK